MEQLHFSYRRGTGLAEKAERLQRVVEDSVAVNEVVKTVGHKIIELGAEFKSQSTKSTGIPRAIGQKLDK